MNGRKYVPSLDGYDNGEIPTLSVWDEWDREGMDAEFWPEDEDEA